MPTVTVSSKHQITLPAEIVRALGITPGAKLVMDLVDDRIVTIPQPASWARQYLGMAKGVYGTTQPQVDRRVAEERATWRTDSASDFEDFADYYLRNAGQPSHRLIDALSKRPWSDAPTAQDLVRETSLALGEVDKIMGSELSTRGWVRRVEDPSGTPRYRLRRDLADALRAA